MIRKEELVTLQFSKDTERPYFYHYKGETFYINRNSYHYKRELCSAKTLHNFRSSKSISKEVTPKIIDNRTLNYNLISACWGLFPDMYKLDIFLVKRYE